MDEFEVRVNELYRFYMALGEKLGVETRRKMAEYCINRCYELQMQNTIQIELAQAHNNN